MTDRRPVIVGMVIVALLGLGFSHFVLSPKYDERASVDRQVTQQQEALQKAQRLLSQNERAQQLVRRTPAARVRLGKAVPTSDETASLLVQLDAIARRSKVELSGLDVGGDDATGAAATTSSSSSSSGLASKALSLTLTGKYAGIERALGRIRNLVRLRGTDVRVAGRLLAVDSVTLAPAADDSQGLTATIGGRTFTVSDSDSASASADVTATTNGSARATATPSSATSSGSSAASTTTTTR